LCLSITSLRLYPHTTDHQTLPDGKAAVDGKDIDETQTKQAGVDIQVVDVVTAAETQRRCC